MDPLILNEDESLFREEIRKFAEESIAPLSRAMDAEQKLDSQLIQEIFALGLMGIEIPAEFGGAASSFFMSCLAIEEISRVEPGVGVFVDVQNTLVNNIFKRWASAEQQQKYFPRLASSEVGCFCLTEADSGSDAFALRASAKADGGDWVLDGKKIFITNALEASIYLVFANTNFEAGYKGITAFIIENGMPGLSIGKKEDKLGIRSSSTCEVILEGVRVPQDQVLGEIGKGYKIAIETLNEGRIGIAAQMLGLAQGAFDGAWRYAGERSQFGKTLNRFQGVQFQLAELAADLHVSRLLVYQAARLKDAGRDFVMEAAIAKHRVSSLAERVASQSLEIFGGYGFIKEFMAEKYYRDVKIGKLYEGTSNLQLQTIFRQLGRESS